MNTSTNPLIPTNLLSTSVFHRPANPNRTDSQPSQNTDTSTVAVTSKAGSVGGNTGQLSSTKPKSPIRASTQLATAAPAVTSLTTSTVPATATIVKTESVDQRVLHNTMAAEPPSTSATASVARTGSHDRASQLRSATSTSTSAGDGSTRVLPSPTTAAPSSSSSRRAGSHWDRNERDTRSRDVGRDQTPPRSSERRLSRDDSYRRYRDGSPSMSAQSYYHHHRDDYRYRSPRSHGYGRSSDRDPYYRSQHQYQQDRDGRSPERSHDSSYWDRRRVHHAPPPPPPPALASSTAHPPSSHSETVDLVHPERPDSSGRKRQLRYASDHSMSEAEQPARLHGTEGRGGGSSLATGGSASERRREAKKARRDHDHATAVMVAPVDSPNTRPNRHASESSASNDSSTSDSESDSESGSGKNGSDKQALPAISQQHVRSVEAVRLQGTVHDLMMELEKTQSKHKKYAQKAAQAVKRIQMLSGRLEKAFRQLSEINLEQEQRIAETMKQQQVQLIQLQTREKELEAASATSVTVTPTTVNVPNGAAAGTTERQVGMVVDDDVDSVVDIELESGQASTANIVTARLDDLHLSSNTSGRSSSHRRPSLASGSSNSLSSLAAQADANLARRSAEWNKSATMGRFVLSSKSVVDTLTNLKTDLRSKAFARKPRSLRMYSQLAGEKLKDIMVTSSLDGNIQFWDLISRRVVSQVHKNQLQFPWAEDICWVGKDLLAVASAYAQGQPMLRQLSLVHVSASPATSASGLASGRNGRTTVSSVCQHVDAMPHDKHGINVLAPVDQFSDGSFVLATGGSDKTVYHWRFGAPDSSSEGDYVSLGPQLLHTRHTAAVHGLCYSRFDNVMYSGGTDCRLVAWDMQHKSTVIDYRYTDRGRISHILQNPQDPRLFLISHADKSNQLRLMDTRVGPQDTVLTLGFPAVENISRYVAPCWHPMGGLISCGTTSGTGKIHLWDIRWKNVERGPGQSISVHDKTIFRAEFHPTYPLLASMSSDNTLAFIDFQLNPETVVHNS
ncbi:hypothetical protein BGW41_000258 [Actinomortierella wolfii]|nr:hypothetical protein BGW41_000258 [Actinomortierella wolfii]